jgi:hypothetical protein
VVPAGFVASLVIQPTLMDRIWEAQKGDKEIEDIRNALKEGKAKEFSEDEQGTIWFEKRVCVANDPELRKVIFQEAHETPYSIILETPRCIWTWRRGSGGTTWRDTSLNT